MNEEKIEIKWNPFQQDKPRLSQKEAAQKLHELYVQMQESGFTKFEAITLLSAMLAGGAK